MTRTAPHRLSVSLVTLGDPDTLTGGYLFHRRLAELAPRHDTRLVFASFPAKPFPFPVLYGPRLLRPLSAQRPDVVVLDSIAAAFLAPWAAAARVPIVVMAHQPPGGIDHGPVRRYVQAVLDQTSYRRVERVLVASQLLADQFAAHGFADTLVVAPGRDVAPSTAGQRRDLRGGTRAALLCVGNWVARKGILQALDALSRLPVVGWRAGNLPYLAGHEREGLLAEPGEQAGLVRALRRLAEAEKLRSRLGAAARQRAATFPTWDQTAGRFFGAVREAGGQGRRDPYGDGVTWRGAET
jgi:glycosyltransferase involved in cell wall biosynthesis